MLCAFGMVKTPDFFYCLTFFLPLFMGFIALFDTIYVMSSIVLFKLPFSFIYSIFN